MQDDWRPNTRYPDAAVQVLDASFERYRVFNATLERLATGFRWGEGPVWFGDGRYLLFSDIPNDRIIRWDEATGRTSVFRQPSNQSNGLTRDRQGRLLACEHLTRRVTRTEYDGRITVLADGYNGKRLNSPNDIVCRSDGSVWFTDPTFGIQGWYEGEKAEPELKHGVYRIDGASGELTLVTDELAGPNGLCFTPDEETLYIVESRSTPHRRVWAYDVLDDGRRLGERRLHIDANGPGAFDGIRCDEDGNLWCGWGTGPELDGVMVFDPQGKAIGHIRLPERCANLCFGGARRNRLFMASSHSLYALHVNVRGAIPY
jgi:gluconolactonase